MPLARPIIGEETSNAFRTSRAKIGNEEDNMQRLLAAKEPKPNLDRLVSFMGACALARFDSLVDARYAGQRRTIVTTNLDSESFKGRYGERVADRIRSRERSGVG